MKKKYSAPYMESIKLNTRSILMSSMDGGLGDMNENPIISDAPVFDEEFFNLF